MTAEERDNAIMAFKEWIRRDSEMEYADRIENIEIYKIALEALEAVGNTDRLAKWLEQCRDVTPEERQSVDKYVESISTPTGVTFDGDRAVSLNAVLDKIQTEIYQYNRNPAHYPVDMINIETVLQIIDKYKTVEGNNDKTRCIKDKQFPSTSQLADGDRAVSLNAVINTLDDMTVGKEDNIFTFYRKAKQTISELPSVGKDINIPTTDYISRQAAILQIQRHGVGCFDSDEFSPEQAERFVINLMNELPSVQHKTNRIPEGIKYCDECDHVEICSFYGTTTDCIWKSKTGHWIKDEFGSRCERCGLYAYRDKFDKPWESPYCPYCGSYNGGD